MNSKNFMRGITQLELAYNQKFNTDKLELFWQQLIDIADDEYLKAIKDLIAKNKYLPNVAEIKAEIKEKVIDDDMWSNANLNSSFWYENLREFCEQDNIPYYDITKGINYPLPPSKN